MKNNSLKIFAVMLIVSSLFLTGCINGKKVPNLEAIYAQTKTQSGKRPVIIIPGILGSELEDPATGESAWFNLGSIKGDNLPLPISPDLAKNRDTLIPKRILGKAKVFALFPEVSIYQSLVDAMEKYGGYTEGDWDNPGTEGSADKYYVFAYDWRLDNATNAQILTQKIDALKQKLGAPDLRFNVLAHSMGGLIARYSAMYGEADLQPADMKPVPTWAGARNFNKIFMFGTPNEGSMSALEVLLRGYRVGALSLKVLKSEEAITAPSAFQLLPHTGTVRFYDDNLQLLDVDIYDPETWKKYSWSAFASPAFRNRFTPESAALPDSANFRREYGDATPDDLDAYLAAVLNQAKAFHQALNVDTSVPPSISFFAFGSDCDKTLDAAVIYKNAKTGAWETLFSPKTIKKADGTKIKKEQIEAILYEPGDSRVTRRSLLASTIAEQNYRNSLFRKNLPVAATFFCESHDEIPNSKIVQNNFLTALISEITQ